MLLNLGCIPAPSQGPNVFCGWSCILTIHKIVQQMWEPESCNSLWKILSAFIFLIINSATMASWYYRICFTSRPVNVLELRKSELIMWATVLKSFSILHSSEDRGFGWRLEYEFMKVDRLVCSFIRVGKDCWSSWRHYSMSHVNGIYVGFDGSHSPLSHRVMSTACSHSTGAQAAIYRCNRGQTWLLVQRRG